MNLPPDEETEKQSVYRRDLGQMFKSGPLSRLFMPLSELLFREVAPTLDLFASCKTGEIVAPVSARRRIGWIALQAIIGGVVLLGGKLWIDSQGAAMHALQQTDPAEAAHHGAILMTGFLVGMNALVAGFTIWDVIYTLRILRAGRWPLPGARVLRPTPVISGWCLWLRFGLTAALLLGLTIALAVLSARLVDFGWTGYFNAQLQQQMKPPPRAFAHRIHLH